MNFKADWSFLEKISMGAVSSREVIKMLNEAGHEVIELERYSTSNKIWATKIKRLRLPDLICLKCGRRIESRAKSNLDVRMSDNENNQSRRWDAGLRDEDLIAFIKCEKTEDGWLPGSQVNLFETMSLRETVNSSRLGDPKSPGEGAERDRIWPSSIPKKNGKVIDVMEDDEKLQIKVQYDNGKKYTYSTKREKGYHAYCKPGDVFCANEVMIAGIPTKKEKIDTCQGGYNFLEDLESDVKEVRYAGVKALGYLENKQKYVEKLYLLKKIETDKRVTLEIYSSLIRLGEDVWKEFYEYAMSLDEEEYKFEYVLILAELNEYPEAENILCEIAKDSSMNTEMRSAAAWGIKVSLDSISDLLEIAKSDKDSVASHAIANLIVNYNEEFTLQLIDLIVDDISGGIVLKILTEIEMSDPELIVNIYSKLTSKVQKKWCAMIIGLSVDEKYMVFNEKIKNVDLEKYILIKALWDYSKFSVTSYRNGEIEFLKKQTI